LVVWLVSRECTVDIFAQFLNAILVILKLQLFESWITLPKG